MELPVAFTPQSPGKKSCTLRITSDDPDEPVIERSISARTPPWLGVRASRIDPSGSLDAHHSDGGSLDLVYLQPITARWAWDVQLGLGRFDGLPDIDLTTLSASARFTFNPMAPVQIFLFGGPEVSDFDPGDLELGLQAGVGLHIPTGRRYAVELAGGYHDALTASPDLRHTRLSVGFLVSF